MATRNDTAIAAGAASQRVVGNGSLGVIVTRDVPAPGAPDRWRLPAAVPNGLIDVANMVHDVQDMWQIYVSDMKAMHAMQQNRLLECTMVVCVCVCVYECDLEGLPMCVIV